MYAVGICCGFVAFCLYLKWQPFMARLFLPLFVAGAPLTGAIAGVRVGTARLTTMAQLLFCLLLLVGARLPALQNWTRPLKGPKSVFRTPRRDRYFADLGAWKNQTSYEKAAAVLAASHCRLVGVDITNLQIEYPLMALLRAKAPASLFVHTGVENASQRYEPPVAGSPCAIVCLDCVGDAQRTAHYVDYPYAVTVDKFLVYLRFTSKFPEPPATP
jgi:hypothetical protein